MINLLQIFYGFTCVFVVVVVFNSNDKASFLKGWGFFCDFLVEILSDGYSYEVRAFGHDILNLGAIHIPVALPPQ